MLQFDAVSTDYVGEELRVSGAAFHEAREALVVSGALDAARAELLLLDERLWRHDDRALPICGEKGVLVSAGRPEATTIR